MKQKSIARWSIARWLRSWAEKLDPQTEQSETKTDDRKRKHPGLMSPGEPLGGVPIGPDSIAEPGRGGGRPPRNWLPGEWGGPYV